MPFERSTAGARGSSLAPDTFRIGEISARFFAQRCSIEDRPRAVVALGSCRAVAGVIMGPWFEASRSERISMIHEEINRLPHAYRAALIVCGLERRPVPQAARESGCRERSLERRFARALDCLRVRLTRRCHGVPAGDWDPDIMDELSAIVPSSLIQSTVEVAMRSLGPLSDRDRQARYRTLRSTGRARSASGELTSDSAQQPVATHAHRPRAPVEQRGSDKT